MAETYWLSTCIADKKTTKGTYDERRSAMIDALFAVSDGWWNETTSFLVFNSDKTVSELVAIVKLKLDTSCDIALLGMTEKKTMRLVGAAQHSDVLKSMVDFMAKS